jgi:hypothetical protein
MIMFGDTGGELRGRFRALDQTLTGDITEKNSLYGDAFSMSAKAVGGDDILSGGFTAQENLLVGDAWQMSQHARGGNDILTGGALAEFNVLYGDAFSLSGQTQGGNDLLTGGANTIERNTLYGDAYKMSGEVRGGDDVLQAAVSFYGGANLLYGDAYSMTGWAAGGNDVLVSGSGNDDMWGDAAVMLEEATGGSDTFVFALNNGHDTVHDFEQGKDYIDLTAWGDIGIHVFESLTIVSNGVDTEIQLGSTGSITLLGVGTLLETDVLLA